MKTRSSGSAVLAVLLTVALVTGLLTVVYSLTSNSAISTRRTVNRTVAAAYADAVMESYFDQWRTLMLNSAIPQDRADGVQNSGLTGITVPDSTVIERPSGVQAPVNSGVKAATPMLQPLPLATDRPVPENGTTVASRKRLNYLATVTVPYNVSRGTGSVTLQRIFVRGGRTLFDYFFFGTQPRVEFHPGAPMYVNGDVYVQGELYVAHDDLHFLNDVTFTEKLTIGYSPDDPRTPNTTIDDDAEGVSDNWVIAPHIGSEQKLFDTPQSALDPNFTDSNMANNTDSDGNLNNDGYHEMIEKPAATGNDPLSISDVENHRLSYNADYRVEIDAANNVTIYKRASSATTGAPTETVLSTTNAEYVALKGALTTDNAIFDTREGDYVRVITMDVNKIRIAGEPASVGATPILKDELNVTPNTKDGLAIHLQDNSQGTSLSTYLSTPGTPYIAAIPPVPAVAYQAPVPYKPATYYPNGTIKTKAVPAVPEILAQPAIPGVPAVPAGLTRVTSSAKRGVRLMNGGKLPLNGLTIATPHTAYIQGDYNTGTEGTTKPASNTTTQYTPPADNPSPWVSGYDHANRPAAVIADAVNILSNAWNDANSPNAKTSRVSSNTTVNCAILAGNVPSTSASYSGGIENFVRLHENWSSKYLTIKGALALLYSSTEALGGWSSASYDAPNRRWYYDDSFQQKTPPGFRYARSFERGMWVSHP